MADLRQGDRYPTFVMEAFSTIASPMFSELVIISTDYPTHCLPQEAVLFNTLHKMYEVKPFKLVFLLEVSDTSDVMQELVDALELVTMKGLLGFLNSQPTIRTMQAEHSGWDSPNFD